MPRAWGHSAQREAAPWTHPALPDRVSLIQKRHRSKGSSQSLDKRGDKSDRNGYYLTRPKMMSSVIPARLTFQCGHAALVTLPRVKGETASQRNERVAFEKAAALGRQCDFCGPAATAIATPLAEAVNGNHEPVTAALDGHAVEVPELVVVVAS